jgi:hypothetical protein
MFVKQGSVFAPLLFNIFFGAIIKAVIERIKDHLSGGTEEKEWSISDYQVNEATEDCRCVY